jgi:hypothetical protein
MKSRGETVSRCHSGTECPNPGVQTHEKPFCPPCLTAAAEDIADLPLAYLALAGALVKSRGAASDERRDPNRPESSPPLNEHADALMRRVVWMVAAWEGRLEDFRARPIPSYENTRPGFLTARAAALLSGAIGELAALPCALTADSPHRAEYLDGIDAVNRLRALHAVCRAFLGLTEKKIRLPGDCPGCGGLTLSRYDGGDHVACDLCKRRWPYPEYQRYVSLVTDIRADSTNRPVMP